MNTVKFSLLAFAVGILVLIFAHWLKLDYFYFAGYTILQFIVMATAWNILGGYCGYVNFGSAAFFALGAYASVFVHKVYPLPVPLPLARKPSATARAATSPGASPAGPRATSASESFGIPRAQANRSLWCSMPASWFSTPPWKTQPWCS